MKILSSVVLMSFFCNFSLVNLPNKNAILGKSLDETIALPTNQDII